MEKERPPPYLTTTTALCLPEVPLRSPQASEQNSLLEDGSPRSTLNRTAANHSHDSSPQWSPHNAHRRKPEAHEPLDLPRVPLHSPSSQILYTEPTPMRRDISITLSDPDDRTAAEALLGLGKAQKQQEEHPQQPQSTAKLTGFETPLKYYPIDIEHTTPGSPTSGSQPEPLLALLTSSHPWLGGTLSASSTAYSASKSFSPRFVQFGANLVENTVGTVGRKTGVEGSIRRYLDARQPPSTTQDPAKRIDAKILDPETARDLASSALPPTRKASNTSIDSLPQYDDNRSPAYEEVHPSTPNPQSRHEITAHTRVPPRSWSTQLMISTSGLGAALNENALRSLKFCLSTLHSANTRVRYLVEALKRLLQDYTSSSSNRSLEAGQPAQPSDGEDTPMTDAPPARDPPSLIAERIKALNAEIWATFKNVVNSVSQYTGGALPENASMVVKWQLMSVPQRWQRAVTKTGGNARETDPVGSANRMVEFAVEGLDMMDQVGGVVESTICSAERWLDSMGRKKDGETDGEGMEREAQGDKEA